MNKNLTPWPPGVSGNPAGRPKEAPLITPALRRLAKMQVADLRSLLAQVKEGEVPEGMTVAEAIALVTLKKALTNEAQGDVTRELVIKRLDGESTDINIDARQIHVALKWAADE